MLRKLPCARLYINFTCFTGSRRLCRLVSSSRPPAPLPSPGQGRRPSSPPQVPPSRRPCTAPRAPCCWRPLYPPYRTCRISRLGPWPVPSRAAAESSHRWRACAPASSAPCREEGERRRGGRSGEEEKAAAADSGVVGDVGFLARWAGRLLIWYGHGPQLSVQLKLRLVCFVGYNCILDQNTSWVSGHFGPRTLPIGVLVGIKRVLSVQFFFTFFIKIV